MRKCAFNLHEMETELSPPLCILYGLQKVVGRGERSLTFLSYKSPNSDQPMLTSLTPCKENCIVHTYIVENIVVHCESYEPYLLDGNLIYCTGFDHTEADRCKCAWFIHLMLALSYKGRRDCFETSLIEKMRCMANPGPGKGNILGSLYRQINTNKSVLQTSVPLLPNVLVS